MIFTMTWHSKTLYIRKFYIRRNNKKARQQEKRDKQLIFKYCAPFTDCVIEINNPQMHNIKYVDVMMPLYNLTE